MSSILLFLFFIVYKYSSELILLPNVFQFSPFLSTAQPHHSLSYNRLPDFPLQEPTEPPASLLKASPTLHSSVHQRRAHANLHNSGLLIKPSSAQAHLAMGSSQLL